jgi:acyl carrier protein
MPIASRTPEGWPNRCPICGADVWIDPSQPPGDAPCPKCGQLLWFDDADNRRRILELIAARLNLNPNEIDLDSPLPDYGADSLDVVELILELEEQFDATIPDEAADKIRTVRDLIEWLMRRTRKPPEGD